jgi:hypothetical protein
MKTTILRSSSAASPALRYSPSPARSMAANEPQGRSEGVSEVPLTDSKALVR